MGWRRGRWSDRSAVLTGSRPDPTPATNRRATGLEVTSAHVDADHRFDQPVKTAYRRGDRRKRQDSRTKTKLPVVDGPGIHSECGFQRWTPWQRLDFQKIEARLQTFWETNQTFKAVDRHVEPKYTCSTCSVSVGRGLHIDIPRATRRTDIVARHRGRGFQCAPSIVWNAFGLPAEQHAWKTGAHRESTPRQTSDVPPPAPSRWVFLRGLSREVNHDGFSRLFDVDTSGLPASCFQN